LYFNSVSDPSKPLTFCADLSHISGAGSNTAFFVPSLDLIALRTGRSDDGLAEEVEEEFLKRLFGGLQR